MVMAKVIVKYKQCKQCGTIFRRTTPYNRTPYCSELCRAVARRTQCRNYMRKRREYVSDNAGTRDFVDMAIVGNRVKSAVKLERMCRKK